VQPTTDRDAKITLIRSALRRDIVKYYIYGCIPGRRQFCWPCSRLCRTVHGVVRPEPGHGLVAKQNKIKSVAATTAQPPGWRASRPLVALDQDSIVIAVIEVSDSSWLIAGDQPGVGGCQPEPDSSRSIR
jgi:hypothetical protein